MWNVKNLNGSIAISGHVPGEVHTDLMRVGILGDPYYRYNDFEYDFLANLSLVDTNGSEEILGLIRAPSKLIMT